MLIDVDISLSPLLDSRGEVEGFVSIARDISRRRRSEEAGFASHLVKPIDAKKLIHLVDALARPGAAASSL